MHISFPLEVFPDFCVPTNGTEAGRILEKKEGASPRQRTAVNDSGEMLHSSNISRYCSVELLTSRRANPVSLARPVAVEGLANEIWLKSADIWYVTPCGSSASFAPYC
jgi:hypothetical protein